MTNLFDELHIGPLAARNRIVRAATAESLCTKEGTPSKRLIDYYGELSKGDVGTIITGYAYVCADGKPAERSLNLSETASLSTLKELTEHVHASTSEPPIDPVPAPATISKTGKITPKPVKEHAKEAKVSSGLDSQGARIVAQLVYGGSKSKLAAGDPRFLATSAQEPQDGVSNVDIVGPSAIVNPATGLVPRVATKADITHIIKAFAAAALRARKTGFDGVELHAAHGYLLSQFLDGRFNKRTDEYGGSLQNRARLACECVEAIREQVGEEFPVFVKLNSCDVAKDPMGKAGGMSEEESMAVAQMLVEAGASCIDVSGDWHAIPGEEIDGEPFFGTYATRLARKLEAPVIVTGGWRDPDIIDRFFATTEIAAVAMGRPFISESYLVARWSIGNRKPSRCVGCNMCTRQPGIPCVNHGRR